MKYKNSLIFILLLHLSISFHAPVFSRIIIVDYKIATLSTNTYNYETRSTGGEKVAVFKTIQLAVDFATEGDTVLVRGGM